MSEATTDFPPPGRLPEAVDHLAAAAFREELRLLPNDPEAQQGLAAALQQAKGR